MGTLISVAFPNAVPREGELIQRFRSAVLEVFETATSFRLNPSLLSEGLKGCRRQPAGSSSNESNQLHMPCHWAAFLSAQSRQAESAEKQNLGLSHCLSVGD
jgi:hypothetical protein